MRGKEDVLQIQLFLFKALLNWTGAFSILNTIRGMLVYANTKMDKGVMSLDFFQVESVCDFLFFKYFLLAENRPCFFMQVKLFENAR